MYYGASGLAHIQMMQRRSRTSRKSEEFKNDEHGRRANGWMVGKFEVRKLDLTLKL
jgi:hypothetical protein